MPSTVPSPNSYSLRICSNSSTFAFLSIPRLLLFSRILRVCEVGHFTASKWAALESRNHVASIRRDTSPSLVGRPRRRRAPCSLPQNVQVHGQLAHLALEPIDFFFAQRFVFLLASSKCVLRPEQEAIAPPFHFGYLQPVSPRRLNRRGLTLEQADYQGRTTLGRPTLHFFRSL